MNIIKKRLLLSSIACLSIFNLSSCQYASYDSSSSADNFDNSTPINFIRSEQAFSYIPLTEYGVETKVAESANSAGGDFVLFIYLAGCYGCQLLKSYFPKLVNEEHYLIYGTSFSAYSSLYKSNGRPNYIYVGQTPTLLFYQKGVPVGRLVGATSTYSPFKEAFTNMVRPSNVYYLNTAENKTGDDGETTFDYSTIDYTDTSYLDSKIQSSDDINIIFTWNKCSDCQSLFDNWIFDYSNKNLDKTIYLFEVDSFRNPINEKTNPAWSAFAAKYGLNNYLTGKVPSVINYKNGAFNKMVVYHNRGESSKNSDGSYSFLSAYNDEINDLKGSSEEDLVNKAEKKELELIQALYQ